MLVALVLKETGGVSKIILGDFTTNCARLICAVLLHMIIMPEVRGAFKLMNIAKNSPEAFKGSSSVAYYVCMLQIIAGFATEWCNMINIIDADNVIDVVKDFIALGIIAEIDNVMLLTVKHIEFEKEVEELDFQVKKT